MTDLFDEPFEMVIVLQYVGYLSKGVQSHAPIRRHDKDVGFPLEQVSQDKHTSQVGLAVLSSDKQQVCLANPHALLVHSQHVLENVLLPRQQWNLNNLA